MKRSTGQHGDLPPEADSVRKAACVEPCASTTRSAEAVNRCDEANLEVTVTDILEALPFYVMLVDEHHHILQANRAVHSHLGLQPENIVGEYCPKVIHGLDEPWYACPLEEAVERGGEPVEREAFDETSGRWVRSVVYPLASCSRDGGRIYFHSVSDITDRKEAEEQLLASQAQLRELSQYLESVREEERTKMAREIHDELGQSLTALKFDVSWLSRQSPEEWDRLSERTRSMSEVVDGAIQTVKRLSAELRPGLLDDLGLVDAIQWQAQEFAKRTDIKTTFSASPKDFSLDRERSTALFRICQEALTNIARHAEAKRVKISLKKTRNHVLLKISDNGIGIHEDKILDPKAFGLIGIRERAGFFGGEAMMTGVAGKGTVVAVHIPLPRREESDAQDIDRR